MIASAMLQSNSSPDPSDGVRGDEPAAHLHLHLLSLSPPYASSHAGSMPSGGGQSGREMALVRLVGSIYYSVLVLVGTLGNLVAVCALRRNASMSAHSRKLFTALALSDTVVLLINPIRYWIIAVFTVLRHTEMAARAADAEAGMNASSGNWSNWSDWTLVDTNVSLLHAKAAALRPQWSFWDEPDVRLIHSATCKLHSFLTYLARDAATWILVLLSFERFVATCLPHRLLSYQSGPFPPLIYALGSALIIARNAFLLWKLELLEPTAEHLRGYLCDSSDKTFKRLFMMSDLFVYSGLPFLLLLVFNGSILYSLRRSRHRMSYHRNNQQRSTANVALRGPDQHTTSNARISSEASPTIRISRVPSLEFPSARVPPTPENHNGADEAAAAQEANDRATEHTTAYQGHLETAERNTDGQDDAIEHLPENNSSSFVIATRNPIAPCLEEAGADGESVAHADNPIGLQVDQQNRVQFVLVPGTACFPYSLPRDPLSTAKSTSSEQLEATLELLPPAARRKPSAPPPLGTVYEESGPVYSYRRSRSATLPHRPVCRSPGKSRDPHAAHSEHVVFGRSIRYATCRAAVSACASSTSRRRSGETGGAAAAASALSKTRQKKYSSYQAPCVTDLQVSQQNLANECSMPDLLALEEEENPEAEPALQSPTLYSQTYALRSFVASQANAGSSTGSGVRPGQQGAVAGVGARKNGRLASGSGHSSLATSLLVPVSVLHLLTTLPMSVLALIEAVNDMRSRVSSPADRTFLSVILYALMLSYLNHGINCYVYFVSSARFREHLCRTCRHIFRKLTCCSCRVLRRPSIPSVGTSKRCSFDTKSSADTVLAESTSANKPHPNIQLRTVTITNHLRI